MRRARARGLFPRVFAAAPPSNPLVDGRAGGGGGNGGSHLQGLASARSLDPATDPAAVPELGLRGFPRCVDLHGCNGATARAVLRLALEDLSRAADADYEAKTKEKEKAKKEEAKEEVNERGERARLGEHRRVGEMEGGGGAGPAGLKVVTGRGARSKGSGVLLGAAVALLAGLPHGGLAWRGPDPRGLAGGHEGCLVVDDAELRRWLRAGAAARDGRAESLEAGPGFRR